MAAQAQFPNYGYAGFAGYGGYGYSGYPGYPGFTGYGGYPFSGLRTAYPGYSAAAGYPHYGYAGVAGVPQVTTSQYHAQDELGQARYGYAHPGQAAANYRDALGNQIGSYAYFNPEGKEVRVSYTADHRGFRVLSNDLPVAPTAPVAIAANLPVQVQDTPEVAAAKQDHALKWAAAKAATDAAKVATAATAPVAVSRTKRQVVAAPQVYATGTTPLAYSNYAGSPYAYNYGSPYGYSYGSPLAYTNQAYTPLAYTSPLAYNQGAQFGYNFAHPVANQYPYTVTPYGFAPTPYTAINSAPTSTKTA